MRKTSIILLAAGEGKRLGSKNCPKPLTKIHDEPLLVRTIRQFHEIGFDEFIVVVGHNADRIQKEVCTIFPNVTFVNNARYKEDRNIFSLILGMECLLPERNALIIEGDVVFSEESPVSLLPITQKNVSTWLVNGKFQPWQKGGIIEADRNNNIQEIRYSEYAPSLSNWYKNLGCIFVSSNQVGPYLDLLKKYANVSIDTYFMTPWMEHLVNLPARICDIGEDNASSFNTPEEFEHIHKIIQKPELSEVLKIKLAKPEELKHIEEFDPQRVLWLTEKILADSYWDTPLLIDKVHGLVMDGQHRLEVAKKLMLSSVPVIELDYAQIPVFSLRPGDYAVSVHEIIKRALTGKIYPYKTAKHIFPANLPRCNFSLAELGLN